MAKAGKAIKDAAQWTYDKVLKPAGEKIWDTFTKGGGAKTPTTMSPTPGATPSAGPAPSGTGSKSSQEAKEANQTMQHDTMETAEKRLEDAANAHEKEFEEIGNPTHSAEPTEAELARDARLTSANMEDAQRRAAYLAARNTGANRAAASAVAGNQTNEGGQTSAQSALRNTAIGTQADYLNKMGYANALDMEAENKKKGAFLNTILGIFSGAGEGASVGASLGGAR